MTCGMNDGMTVMGGAMVLSAMQKPFRPGDRAWLVDDAGGPTEVTILRIVGKVAADGFDDEALYVLLDPECRERTVRGRERLYSSF